MLRQNKDQHPGQIILLLLLIVALGLVIALSLIQISLTQQQTVRYDDFGVRAYYAAEAGIEDVVPKLKDAADLNGQALDNFLASTTNGISIATAQPIDSNISGAPTFVRTVKRSDPALVVTRTLANNAVTQMDLSDGNGLALEDKKLQVGWQDTTCNPTSGGCDCGAGQCTALVEVTVLSQLANTTNLVVNPSFEAPTTGAAETAGTATGWSVIDASLSGSPIAYIEHETTQNLTRYGTGSGATYAGQSQKITLLSYPGVGQPACSWVKSDGTAVPSANQSSSLVAYYGTAPAAGVCNSTVLGYGKSAFACSTAGSGSCYDVENSFSKIPVASQNQTPGSAGSCLSMTPVAATLFSTATPLAWKCNAQLGSTTSRVGISRAGNLISLGTLPAAANTTFTLSAYVQVQSLNAGQVQLAVDAYDAGNVLIASSHQTVESSHFASNATSGSNWERIYLTFHYNVAMTKINPYIFMTPGATGTFYVDGVQLEQGVTATEYCDSSQTYSSGGITYGQCYANGDGTSYRSNVYYMDKYFYNPRPALSINATPSSYNAIDYNTTTKTIAEFIPIVHASSNRLVRIQTYMGTVSLTVSAIDPANANASYNLPGQDIQIISTGSYQDTKQTVSLTRGLPTLLPQFQFVLNNHGCAEGGGCVAKDLIK